MSEIKEKNSYISFKLNGKEECILAPSNLTNLLNKFALKPEGMVIEVNQRIVQKEAYQNTYIGPGDHIEILRFVGGG